MALLEGEFTALIPRQFGEEIQTIARRISKSKLALFLKIRDFVEENYDKIEATGWQNFYQECATWTGYSADSIDKGLDIIRSYETSRLKYWIEEKGLSFDHIEKANSAQNHCTMYADQILDAAIELGNGNGKVMTVKEMVAFALGGNVKKAAQFAFINTLSKWLRIIPVKFSEWDAAKVEEAKSLINRLMELMK